MLHLFLSALLNPTPVPALALEIYGTNSLENVYSTQNRTLKRLARSSAALFPTSALHFNAGYFLFDVMPLREAKQVCSNQLFAQDLISPAICSGTLIAPDLVLTAGHCIPNAEACSNLSIAFDYQLAGPSNQNSNVGALAANQIYKCKKLIGGRYAPQETHYFEYAVVQLDRLVLDRTPVQLDQQRDLTEGTSIGLIGYPEGLPAKVSQGQIVDNHQDLYSRMDTSLAATFETNLDCGPGCSGAGVFNLQTKKLIGVHTAGYNETYRWDSVLRCNLHQQCDDANGCDSTMLGLVAMGFAFETRISTIGVRLAPWIRASNLRAQSPSL